MNTWLTSLKTNTPQEGFELAIKLSQMGVKYGENADCRGDERTSAHITQMAPIRSMLKGKDTPSVARKSTGTSVTIAARRK